MNKVLPAPESLVDENRIVRLGRFDAPIANPNLEDARVTLKGIPAPAWFRRMRLKEWQHVWLVSPEIYMGMAVVDAKFLGAAFAYVVNRKSGETVERSVESVRAKVHVPRNLDDTEGHLRAKGFSARISNQLSDGSLEYGLRALESADDPALAIDIRLYWDHAKVQPLVVSLPFGGNRALYTVKAVLPVSGEVRVGERRYDLHKETTRALLDVHKAQYPYRSWWKWATFVGHDRAGREIAINLTDNVAREADNYNECAVWVDGVIHQLGPAKFSHPEGDTTGVWQIGTRDNKVRLTFKPRGERHGDVNALVIRSAFHQPFGVYSGEIDLPTGERIVLTDAHGVAEDHVARW